MLVSPGAATVGVTLFLPQKVMTFFSRRPKNLITVIVTTPTLSAFPDDVCPVFL